MKKLTAAIAFVACGISTAAIESPAEASFMDGNDLYADCSARQSSPTYHQEWAKCFGYILGTFDDFMLARYLAGQSEDCAPSNIKAGQLRDVVVKYLEDNPAMRNLPASALVRLSIGEAWPACSA